ncbi:alpha/beta-hydrolase [Aspergillus filifer]
MAFVEKALYLLLLGIAVSAENPTVTISSGVVIGITYSATNLPSCTATANVFLGIPFASSPPQIFSPPEPPASWSTPLSVQTPPPGCIEKSSRDYNFLSDNPPVTQSEDCLYLNVYAPQDATPENLKDVMFWIYGGNLEGGNSNLDYYNGTSFAVHEDVVLVSTNYRLNIYGFPNEPGAAPGKANAGFLDQRLALDWVQKNINKFGGDPARVTIFGESAGGYSVKQLLATPPSPLPFRAAIIESQQRELPGNGTENFLCAAAHFNCENTQCLRDVPERNLTDYIREKNLFFPPVYDNITCISDVRPHIENGQFANMPLLMGTNRDELSSAVYALSGNGTMTPQATLQTFTCPSGAIVNATANRSSSDCGSAAAPAWRYRFSTSVQENTFPDQGATHASEIIFVFGTYNIISPNATFIELSQYMQPLWANFAKDPTAGPGWDAISPQVGDGAGDVDLVLGDIGVNGNPGKEDVAIAGVDEYCAFLLSYSEQLGLAW